MSISKPCEFHLFTLLGSKPFVKSNVITTSVYSSREVIVKYMSNDLFVLYYIIQNIQITSMHFKLLPFEFVGTRKHSWRLCDVILVHWFILFAFWFIILGTLFRHNKLFNVEEFCSTSSCYVIFCNNIMLGYVIGSIWR